MVPLRQKGKENIRCDLSRFTHRKAATKTGMRLNRYKLSMSVILNAKPFIILVKANDTNNAREGETDIDTSKHRTNK